MNGKLKTSRTAECWKTLEKQSLWILGKYWMGRPAGGQGNFGWADLLEAGETLSASLVSEEAQELGHLRDSGFSLLQKTQSKSSFMQFLAFLLVKV